MRRSSSSRALVALMSTFATLGVLGTFSARPAAAAEATVCHDASLARQRTEVNADMVVPQFDPSLGTLLEVQVPSQTVHLDTDAAFESMAQSDVVFAEDMSYEVAFTSPAGLPSPAALIGTIPRVPATSLAAFDGTLDFVGTSAVAQPPIVHDEAASAVSATDAPTLAAFSGAGMMSFHLATTIGEVFHGGGGNVRFQIHTFVAGSVTVCYRYAAAALPVEPVARPPAAGPPVPAAPVPSVPRTAG